MPKQLEIFYTPEIFSQQAFGGISRYFVELVRHLLSADQSPHVIAGLHLNQLLGELPRKAIVGKYFVRGDRRFPQLRPKFNQALCSWMLTRNPHALVHQTYFNNTNYLGSRPFVVTIYDLIHELYRDRFPWLGSAFDPAAQNQRTNCQQAAHLIAISQTTKSDVVRLYGIDPAKITVIHLSNSLPLLEEASHLPIVPGCSNPKEGNEFLLFVGPRDGYKNFDNLLQGFAHSPQWRRRFRLLCFGGGPFRDEERSRIAAFNLADRVTQQDGDDQALIQYYGQATAFVYPSLYEGFGLPLLEAMSQHCPVICSNGGSIPEVAGSAASYFDPEDPEAIQAVLEETLFNDTRLNTLIEQGKIRVKLFSWERCARSTLAVYRQVCG